MFQPQVDLQQGIVRLGNTQTCRNALNKFPSNEQMKVIVPQTPVEN